MKGDQISAGRRVFERRGTGERVNLPRIISRRDVEDGRAARGPQIAGLRNAEDAGTADFARMAVAIDEPLQRTSDCRGQQAAEPMAAMEHLLLGVRVALARRGF